MLRKVTKLEYVKLSKTCVFFQQENVQQQVGGQNQSRGLRNRLYASREKADLKNTVTSAYRDSMQHHVQNKCEFLQGDVDFFYVSSEKNSADDTMSTNTVTLEITRAVDDNCVMDVWSD